MIQIFKFLMQGACLEYKSWGTESYIYNIIEREQKIPSLPVVPKNLRHRYSIEIECRRHM